jgi:putative hydrolase of the HAD superfamily
MKVVFDLGAVVFRWRPAVLLSQVLPHRAADAVRAEALVRSFFQDFDGGDWGAFDRGTIGVPQLVPRMAERLGLPASEVQQVVDAVPAELQLLPDTLALMQRLRTAGHGLHYLSNMPAPYAEHLEGRFPFEQWFDGGVFSSRVQLIKPEPAIYALAQRQFEAAPDELLFIDDSPRNVEAARAAGWQALHFTDAQRLQADLLAAGLLAPA